MDVKFYDSIFGGDSPNGVKLGMGLTGGDFWPRVNQCHTVYRGQDGNIDYDPIVAVMEFADTLVTIPHQALPPDTIWHYLRRQVSGCGLESESSYPCKVVIDSNGDMMPKVPNSPLSLAVDPLAGGKLKVRWRYILPLQEVPPTGFKVYMDSGSGFDFDTPTATIPVGLPMDRFTIKQGQFEWTSGALNHGQLYRFVVRAYNDTYGETLNTDYVSATADAIGPPAITGITAQWQKAD